MLPNGSELLALQVRSVPKSLTDWLPAPSHALVAVASGWLGFLKMARTMLIAAGFKPDNLMLRDARKRGWQRGLNEAAAVICDVLTAKNLQGLKRVFCFRSFRMRLWTNSGVTRNSSDSFFFPDVTLQKPPQS